MAIIEGNNIWIKRGRLSFPDIVKPKTRKHDDGSTSQVYGANILMEPSQEEVAEIKQLAAQVAQQKWPDKHEAVMAMITGEKKLRCYGPGEEKVSQSTFKPYDGYEGAFFITGVNAAIPQLIGTDGQPLPPTANLNQLFNGGNYVSAIYNMWAQDNTHGKAIRAKLVALQFLEKGESFGSEDVDAVSVFTPVAGAPAAASGAIPMPGAPDPLG